MKRRKDLILRYTKDVRTLDTCRLDLDSGVTAEVFGDPENASYEWCLVHANGLVEQHSDCGYGIPAIAMRDALVVYYGTPQLRVDVVDLRPAGNQATRQREEVAEISKLSPASLIEAADAALEKMRRNAERYELLRTHWLRIDSGSIVHRAAGLDMWCDKHLPVSDPSPSNGRNRQ